jgi:hypothetical protein
MKITHKIQRSVTPAMVFEAELPLHKCGLELNHNPHLGYYETAASWINTSDDQGPDWESDEDKALAIENNDFWTIQWFPQTPIGSCYIAASDLNKLLEFAATVE